MRLRGVLLLAATASVGAVLMLAGPASAANLHCGQSLTSSVTLIGNLDCSSGWPGGDAITIGAKNVVFNLNGFKITGYAGDDVIDTEDYNGVTIKGGGLVITGDGNGVDGSESNSLTLAGLTITGDGATANDGVENGYASGLSLTGSTITGVRNGVENFETIGALIKGNTFAMYEPNPVGPGAGPNHCAGVNEHNGTGNMIVSNKMSATSAYTNPTPCYGLRTQYSAGTLFSGNTVTGMYSGAESKEYDAGLTITGNVLSGNDDGVSLDEYDSGDVIAGNYIKNSVDEGIYDYESFNNTYNGNVLTSNGSTSSDYTYDIEPTGYGPVTMVNNYARTGDGFGFYVYEAYTDSVPGGPYSLFTGNVATANGSSFDPGFYDEYSVGATWSKNVANYNNDQGFDFCAPWRETVTGNSANLNGGDGYYFEYDCGEAETVTPNNPGTIEGSQPLAVTGNSATNNGLVGFDATFPIAGSGNTGGSTNTDGDCYLVAGCS